MIRKSPSGALSPYYYKGGYFHGIHYGSYFDDSAALFDMISKEQDYILKSPEQRRILMDFYETELTDEVLNKIAEHIKYIYPKIIKLAIATDKTGLKKIRKAIIKANAIEIGRCYFSTEMEDGKTWLVSEEN